MWIVIAGRLDKRVVVVGTEMVSHEEEEDDEATDTDDEGEDGEEDRKEQLLVQDVVLFVVCGEYSGD